MMPAKFTLENYVCSLIEPTGKKLKAGEVLAKILTKNDDSGRHGVLIPTEHYEFFPDLPIANPDDNATELFDAYDCIAKQTVTLAWKYYQRYPERRVTRLNGILNNKTQGHILAIFVKAQHTDGSFGYYIDGALSADGQKFEQIYSLIFSQDLSPTPGLVGLRDVKSSQLNIDEALTDLLEKFDQVAEMGWIESMRGGDTGIGYTFESLLGIEENNDKKADFRGIEIKCKQVKYETTRASGKINLFQQGPTWSSELSSYARLEKIGKLSEEGKLACYSQITTKENNLGLILEIGRENETIDLLKHIEQIGFWRYAMLEKRLLEKHSRTAFIKADVSKSGNQFKYKEFVYCEQPSIQKFIQLVLRNEIVFEFTMSEKANRTVRNHGYPWRLNHEDLLDKLFATKLQLR
jgi:hypothetical protein